MLLFLSVKLLLIFSSSRLAVGGDRGVFLLPVDVVCRSTRWLYYAMHDTLVAYAFMIRSMMPILCQFNSSIDSSLIGNLIRYRR